MTATSKDSEGWLMVPGGYMSPGRVGASPKTPSDPVIVAGLWNVA